MYFHEMKCYNWKKNSNKYSLPGLIYEKKKIIPHSNLQRRRVARGVWWPNQKSYDRFISQKTFGNEFRPSTSSPSSVLTSNDALRTQRMEWPPSVRGMKSSNFTTEAGTLEDSPVPVTTLSSITHMQRDTKELKLFIPTRNNTYVIMLSI